MRNVVESRSPELSVVVPVYECEGCLRRLHERLTASLTALVSDYELIFVDDRGGDRSWDVLTELAHGDPRVRALRLSRNFGQATAITAGLAHSRGSHVVVMDCDLQDHPEDIAQLYAKAREGYDVVFTRRASRSQTRFRRLTAWLYFRSRNRLLGIDADTQHGSLLLMSRKVVQAFLAVRDRDRHHVLILYWLGFETVTVEVEQAERFEGKSSYTLRKLVQSGVDGLFFQTTILMKWIVYLGFALAGLGLALAVALVVWGIIRDPPPGWTSLAVLSLVIGGFTITSLGVAALYIGKIFDQVKERPLYLIDREVGGGVEEDLEAVRTASESSPTA
jgi:dolichol-phosphate mannosyltransferase